MEITALRSAQIHQETQDGSSAPLPLGLGREVLIVEDNNGVRTLMSFLLRSVGYKVTHLTTGDEAKNYILHNAPPTLILLDRMLPGISGDSIMRLVQASEQWAKTPIVIVSARSDLNEMAQLMQAGAASYLIKPFRPVEIFRVVNKFSR